MSFVRSPYFGRSGASRTSSATWFAGGTTSAARGTAACSARSARRGTSWTSRRPYARSARASTLPSRSGSWRALALAVTTPVSRCINHAYLGCRRSGRSYLADFGCSILLHTVSKKCLTQSIYSHYWQKVPYTRYIMAYPFPVVF